MQIFWTDEERLRLVELCFKMRLNDPLSSLTAIVNRAQEQLPPERRRTIQAVGTFCPWLVEAVQGRIKILREQAAKPTHINQPPVIINEAPKISREQIIAEISTSELQSILSARQLAQEEAREAKIKFLTEALGRIEGKLAWVGGKGEAARIVRTKLCVIGLKPNQMNEVRTAMPHIDFHMIEADDPRYHVQNDEEVFLMTKFINHSCMGVVKPERRHWCNGGTSQLIAEIKAYLSRQSNGSSMRTQTHALRA